MRGTVMTAALLAMTLIGVDLSKPASAQDPTNPAAPTTQAPGTSVPVVTEAKRREILQAAAALTKETLADVLRRADGGDVEAQVLAGIALQEGKAAPRDLEAAARWIRAAAESGHPMAENMLGNVFNFGAGMPRDPEKGIEWYTKAAAQGYAQAQSNLGRRYLLGEGVAANPGEGVRLFRLAAEQGNVDAQTGLGVAYQYGKGVEKDTREAAMWYRKAAEQDGAEAQRFLGVLYALGIGVPRDMAQAAAWFRKAAELGDAAAQVNVGIAYERGEGVPKDKAGAERWYTKASEQGNAFGSFHLGWLYLRKPGPGRTDPLATYTAVKYLKLSAEQGYPVAAFVLGEVFSYRLFPYHVEKDNLEACTWYATASNLDKEGQWELEQPEPVAQMRKDLPGRTEKVRKSLDATQRAECDRRASAWATAHPSGRK